MFIWPGDGAEMDGKEPVALKRAVDMIKIARMMIRISKVPICQERRGE
jgi:hypothetical protein